MNLPTPSRKALLLASWSAVLLFAAAGCTDERPPSDILVETIANLLKGLIDTGAAAVLGY